MTYDIPSIKETLRMYEPVRISEISEPDIPEAILHQRMINYMSKWFNVYSEVWSKSKNKRIDLIVVHKSDERKYFPVGIEIKTTSKKCGKELAAWLSQASEYSLNEFPPFGKCLVVTCPQVSDYYLREGERMSQHKADDLMGYQNNISTFLGQFGVGEFQKYYRSERKYFRIVFKGSLIWDSYRDDFRTDNYLRICKK